LFQFFDCFGALPIVREAKTKAEAKALLEDGFDWVMDKEGVSLFRKLK
jgi:hypothetical protein